MTASLTNPLHLEQAIIAGVLLDGDALRIPEVRALQPGHLRHLGWLWAMVRELADGGQSVDLATLAQHRNDPRWPEGYSVNDLVNLTAYSIPAQELPGAALGILNALRWTAAREVGIKLQRALSEAPEGSPAPAITQAHATLTELLGTSISDATERVGENVSEALDRILNPQKHRGPTTGLPTFDAVLGGWQPRTLNILAARPSMGKSALLSQLAQAAALHGHRALMFTLEDGLTVTRMRSLVRLSGVEIRHDRAPSMCEQRALQSAAAKLAEMQDRWLIDEEHTLDGIIAACWRQHARAPLGLIIIDQLSHVQATTPKTRADNRTQLYGHITKTLKREVAQRLGVPVLLASQLSRENTKRSENRPELTDLRDSGEIEQDADTVTFIHRPDYYDPADKPGMAELLIRKNRNGPTKDVHLICNMKLFKFWEPGQPQEHV